MSRLPVSRTALKRGAQASVPRPLSRIFGVTVAWPGTGSRGGGNAQRIDCRLSLTYSTSINTSASVETLTGLYFALSQFSQGSALAAIFDEYRLAKVEVWVTPITSTSNGAMLVTAIDLDNASAPASTTALMAKPGATVAWLANSVGHYHKFVPRTAIATYNGAFTGYSEGPVGNWIDCASTGVQYYGIKIAAGVDSAVHTVDITVRGHFEFRGIAA